MAYGFADVSCCFEKMDLLYTNDRYPSLGSNLKMIRLICYPSRFVEKRTFHMLPMGIADKTLTIPRIASELLYKNCSPKFNNQCSGIVKSKFKKDKAYDAYWYSPIFTLHLRLDVQRVWWRVLPLKSIVTCLCRKRSCLPTHWYRTYFVW